MDSSHTDTDLDFEFLDFSSRMTFFLCSNPENSFKKIIKSAVSIRDECLNPFHHKNRGTGFDWVINSDVDDQLDAVTSVSGRSRCSKRYMKR
ncbi:hypothetical protein BpHYR1_023490 [Brachionus plicatilis]|uniref:Uncharacterized protein n=1 Tax=Brachionus plicatilis TaxID=10195 RepID=A0A3M7SE03_BRAPC|nr:hypothetical protein BpHYR1_023490 [Brachionus plicatilis]